MLNDITTDLADPPRYERAEERPGDFDRQTAAEHRKTYPGLTGLILAKSPEAAWRQALAIAQARGWRIVGGGEAELRIEAVAVTRLLRYKDDVVIRIRPHDEGALVDMRSKSRVGKGDFGANAKRIKAFLRDLGAI